MVVVVDKQEEKKRTVSPLANERDQEPFNGQFIHKFFPFELHPVSYPTLTSTHTVCIFFHLNFGGDW